MLSEIAIEVLHFLARRDLDKASGVNKWLDALIANYCEGYPLRVVHRVYMSRYKKGVSVTVMEDLFSGTDYSFSTGSMCEALHFAGTVLRHSYVKHGFQLNTVTLSSDHWPMLIDAILSGTVRRLQFVIVDFGALDIDAFLVVVGLRCLQSLEFERSVVSNGFVTDDLIRSSVAKGIRGLTLEEITGERSLGLSEDAVLDFFIRADSEPEEQPLSLVLDGYDVSDNFVTKFFERLHSSTVQAGSLHLYCATNQRGLSAFAHYKAPSRNELTDTYRFPSIDDDDISYEVSLMLSSSYVGLWLRPQWRL